MSVFSIKDIELLTGIKAHTLRIWEQRYNLPQPGRTPTNIRRYEDEDLRLLLNVSLLNREGHKISEIAKMPPEEIQKLALEYSLHTSDHPDYIRQFTSATINLDEHVFNHVLSKCILQFGIQKTYAQVVFPFLENLGVLWQAGTVNPAYEHFISNLLRQKLYVAIDAIEKSTKTVQKKFLLFLPEGEEHELGLLFANYLIRASGHDTLYLGANLPMDTLGKIKDRYHPDFIFTSFTCSTDTRECVTMLTQCRKIFPQAGILTTGKKMSGIREELPDWIFPVKQVKDLDVYLQ